MRIARALLSLIGTAILGLLATYIMIPEWVLMNLEQNPWQTVGGFLISATFGGAAVFIVYATYINWKLGSKPCKAFEDLRDINGLVECRSLADMVEPIRKLADKDELNELRIQLAAKDAEIAALKSAKMPTPLDLLKTRLGEDGVSAFRALCAASTYVDGMPARPLVFDLDGSKLRAIGLTTGELRHMADAGAIRLVEADERDIVGTNACDITVDLGYGVSADSSAIRFQLAGEESVEVGPVPLNHGTDSFVVMKGYLKGADLGLASFTADGAELARECCAQKPPMGMDGYIRDAYDVKLRSSRRHFRYLTEDGELKSS